MANVKKIQAPHSETGKTVYAIVKREADGYLLNDADGAFASGPADPYLALTEHGTIKGLYEASESRTAWTDGRYTVMAYEQAGGSPAPATDTKVASGEMKVEADTEVEEITLSEMLDGGVAKEATVDFIEKWVLNRLSITVNGDGTETVRLFDNDSSTVLKTWTWDPATKTRAMAV